MWRQKDAIHSIVIELSYSQPILCASRKEGSDDHREFPLR
jgi:hypothetical protein